MPVLAALGGGDPSWSLLAALAALGGLLALDDTALAQTWFSQPLPAGLLAGLALGDPLTGLAVGLPLQIALAGNLPVGQTFIGDPTTAVVATVAAAVLADHPQAPALRDGSPGLPMLGWLLLAAALISLAGHFLIQAERRAHVAWMLEGHRTLRDGDLGRIRRLHVRCLASTFLRGAIGTVLALVLVLRAWIPLFDQLPGRLVTALGLLAVLLPGLGIGTIIERYGPRRSAPWLGAGLGLMILLRLVVR